MIVLKKVILIFMIAGLITGLTVFAAYSGSFDTDTGGYTEEEDGEAVFRDLSLGGSQGMGAQSITTSAVGWGDPVLVDTTGDVGLYTSLEVINGHPAISYFDATNRHIKYVRAEDPAGLTWGAPVVIDATGIASGDNSLAMVDGHPAISYQYEKDLYSDCQLRYVQASDPDGVIWGDPVIVDTADIIGSTSLVVVDGNPAISYYSNDGYGDLKYVRADDLVGASWGVPVVVDAGGLRGFGSSMAIVYGNPAIAYRDTDEDLEGDLRYVRAEDAAGLTWGTPVIVDGEGNAGGSPSLEVVDGHPAISYTYYEWEYYWRADLRYIRAEDAVGLIWGSPVSVDTPGNAGTYTSLEVVEGHPAISYYDDGNADLKYVRAEDTAGASWGVPVAVDTEGWVGRHTSLAVVDGQPAISYLDGNGTDLKYIRAEPLIQASMHPYLPPIIIPPEGGSFHFQATVENLTNQIVTGDAWIMATMPGGSPYGPVQGPIPLTLQPGHIVSDIVEQEVTGSAPPGQYNYILKVGRYPDLILDSDNFIFTKE
jgi:hypothetical protein